LPHITAHPGSRPLTLKTPRSSTRISGQYARRSALPENRVQRAQTGRYACVPGLSIGRLRLPSVLTGLAARLRHSASRAAVRRHRPAPGIGSVKNGQPDGRCPAKVPVRRGAPGSSRGAAARRQAHRAAPRRNLRLSGAAHQRTQRRTDTSARRARVLRSRQRARSPGGQARLLGVGRTAMTASTSGLLANAATVTGRNGPPGGPGGGRVARVTGPARRGFAQVTG
jgi:hypothetical protein